MPTGSLTLRFASWAVCLPNAVLRICAVFGGVGSGFFDDPLELVEALLVSQPVDEAIELVAGELAGTGSVGLLHSYDETASSSRLQIVRPGQSLSSSVCALAACASRASSRVTKWLQSAEDAWKT